MTREDFEIKKMNPTTLGLYYKGKCIDATGYNPSCYTGKRMTKNSWGCLKQSLEVDINRYLASPQTLENKLKHLNCELG